MNKLQKYFRNRWVVAGSILGGLFGSPFALITAIDIGGLFGVGYGDQILPIYGLAIGFIIVFILVLIFLLGAYGLLGGLIGAGIEIAFRTILSRMKNCRR